MLKFVLSKIKQLDEHTLEVVIKSASSMVVKIAALFIGVLLSIALGRLLGADGLGLFSLADRVINILIVLGLMGVRQVIIKKIAIAYANKDYQTIGNIMHSAYWLNGVCTLIASIFLVVSAPWIAETIFSKPELTYPLIILLLALTPQMFSMLYSSALIGYRKIWQSNLVDQALSIAITSILLLMLWLSKVEITVNLVALLYAIGRVSVTLTVGLYWRKIFKHKGPFEIDAKGLLSYSSPFFISTLAAIMIESSATILLGVFSEAQEIGKYAIALKLAMLTSFFLQVSASSIGPKIAALYDSGDIAATKVMVKKITLILVFLSAIPLVIFLLFGSKLLSVWGGEFKSAYLVLAVLSVGQFVNVVSNTATQLLLMTGQQVTNRNIVFCSLFLNLFLSLLLIPSYGALGAASALALTLLAMNLARIFLAHKYTKIFIF